MTLPSAISFSLAVTCLANAGYCATVTGKIELTKSKDLSGVVVWLEPVGGAPPVGEQTTARMAHKNKTFIPSVLAVRTG
ncbi:MAG: hypothetical protein ABI823_09310, partial [Bryobacteraceae bacterium]